MTDDRRPDGAEELEIVVDGHTYRSADEMPPDVRGVYEQMRKALSSAVDDPNSEVETMPGGRIIRSEGTEVTLDGRHVDPADLPPKLRRAYEEALAELDHAEEFQGPGRDRTVGEARGACTGTRCASRAGRSWVAARASPASCTAPSG